MIKKGDNMDKVSIPFVVHEAALERQDRVIKRLWILCIVMFMAFALSNIAWIVYESRYEDETITVSQENEDGINNYIGNDGDITNGSADNND